MGTDLVCVQVCPEGYFRLSNRKAHFGRDIDISMHNSPKFTMNLHGTVNHGSADLTTRGIGARNRP